MRLSSSATERPMNHIRTTLHVKLSGLKKSKSCKNKLDGMTGLNPALRGYETDVRRDCSHQAIQPQDLTVALKSMRVYTANGILNNYTNSHEMLMFYKSTPSSNKADEKNDDRRITFVPIVNRKLLYQKLDQLFKITILCFFHLPTLAVVILRVVENVLVKVFRRSNSRALGGLIWIWKLL